MGEEKEPKTEFMKVVRSETIYLNERLDIVPEDEATVIVIRKLDKDGELVEEVWVTKEKWKE